MASWAMRAFAWRVCSKKRFFKKFNKADQVNTDFFCYLCVINHGKKKRLS